MGRELGLPGFALGLLAGSAFTLLLTTRGYGRAPADLNVSQAGEERQGSDADSTEHSNEDEVYFEGPLNDTIGYEPRNSRGQTNDHLSNSSQYHRRDSSLSSLGDSQQRRRSSNDNLEDEDEVTSLSSATIKTNYAENPDAGTNCQVISHSDWEADNDVIRQAKEFEEQILSKLKSTKDMEIALRRTRAVNALAHTLALAEGERGCFEVVSKLIVPLFKIDGCAFVLLKDSETVIVKHVTVTKQEYATKLGLQGGPEGVEIPIKDTAFSLCRETLQQYYIPRTKESSFAGIRRITYSLGLNTQLTTPIIINGDKFAGCIVTAMEQQDAFSEIDRMLVNNVAHMLGASIYSKRLRLAAESSNKISREILHSLIPPQVIEKIECFWDETSSQYQDRRSSSFVTSQCSSLEDSDRDYRLDDKLDLLAEDNDIASPEKSLKVKELRKRRQSIKNKINLLNNLNNDGPSDHVGVVIDTSAMELGSTHRALYAETVPNVCIIFTDIVNFSQIALDMKPIKVMDMLQDLFSRFDALCDRFGIRKLETIGDAYICTTPMFDQDEDKNDPITAENVLKMAKEMVKEARRVLVPKKNLIQTLEIRVGIHRGELTCGVLGERLPKFTVFGSAVNLAARMEQTCTPSKIRVTKDFFQTLSESEGKILEAKEVISVKNMGQVETYLLNPLHEEHECTFLPTNHVIESGSSSLYD